MLLGWCLCGTNECCNCVLLQDAVLLAYQIGFDLYESATQDFLQRVLAALRKTPQPPAAADKPADDR